MSEEIVGKYSCFDVTIKNNVAHIVLNRPEEMNTMSRPFWNEIKELVGDISDNAKARCIVFSSTGKHFSAGMDLSVFDGSGLGDTTSLNDPETVMEADRLFVRYVQSIFDRIDRTRMPVLVAIQGGCIGGAVDMISACDVRYATADAFFCIQEINLGMTADAGTFPRLCKLIPEGWVRELAYTGRRLPAQRAKEIGLINEVFDDHESLIKYVINTAEEIASKAPLAVAGSKEMINYARDHTIADGLDHIATWQMGMFSQKHMQEIVDAKNEKRTPVFPNLLPLRKQL